MLIAEYTPNDLMSSAVLHRCVVRLIQGAVSALILLLIWRITPSRRLRHSTRYSDNFFCDILR